MVEVKPKSPVKAIREYCLDKCALSPKEVRECALLCPLHPYRFGTNPNRAGKGGNPNLSRGKRNPRAAGDPVSDDQLLRLIERRLKESRNG
jgi:hypothetical protein